MVLGIRALLPKGTSNSSQWSKFLRSYARFFQQKKGQKTYFSYFWGNAVSGNIEFIESKIKKGKNA